MLKEKLITAMYTNAKVDGHFIKLILNSKLAGSIITKQLMDQLSHQVDRAASTQIITADKTTKTLINEIDNFSIEVNSIIMSIKILVIKATQYQALIGNDWLFKTNVMLDWNMQELQLSQNATCGHFKTTNILTPLIELKKEEKKPTWEAYQSGKRIQKKKKKKKKKKQHPLAPPCIIPTPTLCYNNSLIANQSLYVLIVTRNCCQWTHTVAIIKNTKWQLSSIAIHVLLNALKDQNELENGIISHAWLVEKLSSTKKCGMTFLEEEKHATNHVKPVINLLNLKQFHEHYQELALTREEQEQWLEEINTKLCDHCLIPCDF
ncbi:hypothetical protein G9A89_023724 [Geosiphon pyriformis]|nr:hypothetical protein G9A89_023724 [Geosiphon pyriformis]